MHVAGVVNDRKAQRERLAQVVEERKLRAAIITSYEGVSYFSGAHIITQIVVPDRLEFFMLFADATPALLLCSLETSMVREQTDVTDISEYVEFADVPIEALARLLSERGVTSGRVGVELRRLNAGAFAALRAALPDVEVVGIDDEVERLQAVKTPDEVDMLRYGAQATLDAVLGAAGNAHAGDSELELCGGIAAGMMMRGGVFSFMVFGTGRRALGAHVEPVDRPLAQGDLWRIDLGARFFETIHSDLARTGVVGEPNARQEEVMLALRATQDAGYAALEPGRPAREVFDAVRDEFARQKLPFFMPHIGHGLGIGMHENPMLEPANDMRLEEGMVLNIEPMVVFPDIGECYHTEDLALVTADGHELLTEPQSGLIRIGA
jgi:Xaa-Pro aminopeptidase